MTVHTPDHHRDTLNEDSKLTYTIGQPVIFGNMANAPKLGWIAKVSEHQNKVYTLGANGLKPERLEITVAWENLTTSTVSEGIAKPWAERASREDWKSAEDVASLLERAKEAEAEEYRKRTEELEAKRDALSKFRDSIRDKIPTDAKAVIVAELEIDKCDIMTDYFATSTEKTIILGFSRHTRDLFPELRKAALNHPDTAALHDAGPDAEHREKYSMGAGYYLKDANRYSTGWAVRKRSFYGRRNDVAENIPHGEWAVPEVTEAPKASPKAATSTTSGGVTIEEHTHTKKGFQMWIVTAGGRVDRDTFMAWLGLAKERGGWYSRRWGGTPAGFAFKDQSEAEAFAEGLKVVA